MAHSAHFKESELACHHCGRNETKQDLVDALELARSKAAEVLGREVELIVIDAYRCPEHNGELKNAATHSQHVLGEAADIKIVGLTAAELYAIVKRIPNFKGIGRNDPKGNCHVDVRIQDHVSRWCYDSAGKTIAWTEPK